MDIVTLNFKDEKLVINHHHQKITITLQKNKLDNSVSLGIDAPRTISVDREEIYRLKKNTHF
jgi:carbon storage regulator